MDTYRGFDDSDVASAYADDEPAIERPPEIGFDERRMHVRAYNYWVSLLAGRPYPSIADVQPERIDDFGPHSVLLDFTEDPEDPKVAYLGSALRAECGLEAHVDRISQVPGRSLLSRLTDHYLQIIANRAPIGFEAEFINSRRVNTLYRGILMPLSTDGDRIDFIYGVINWKELSDSVDVQAIAGEVGRALSSGAREGLPSWADGPNAELPEPQDDPSDAPTRDSETLSLWPDADDDTTGPELDADAGLADRLDLARASADLARTADQRSRAALYRALGHAYDFACAARRAPDDYAELLADSGLTEQARAPMTPIVKLVFGAGYDKARLAEFAAALSWAQRRSLPVGAFAEAIEREGGLKALVVQERAARRPSDRPDPSAAKRRRLVSAPPLAFLPTALAGPVAAGDFVLLVARAESDGRLAVVAPALADERLIAAAIAKSA